MPSGIYKRPPPEERFWARVERAGGCWLWRGPLDRSGYGVFHYAGRTMHAHRFIYIFSRGPIPHGKEIDHLCRNRACVNLAHMGVVSHKENVLRGESPAAMHARITHCPQGHPYDLLNTHWYSNRRYCRMCVRLRVQVRARATPVQQETTSRVDTGHIKEAVNVKVR